MGFGHLLCIGSCIGLLLPAVAASCASSAVVACQQAPRTEPVAFFALSAGLYGVALCDNTTGMALACATRPVSAFILPPGDVNSTDAPPMVSTSYSSVAQASASGVLATPNGGVLKVVDTFSLAPSSARASFGGGAGAALALIRVDRAVTVVQAGTSAGFCSRLSLTLLAPQSPLWDLQWYSPGLLYGSGAYTPPWAIGGQPNRTSTPAVVFREDRAAAPLAVLVSNSTGEGEEQLGPGVWKGQGQGQGPTLAAVLRVAPTDGGGTPNTVLNDTLWGGALVDTRMQFMGLGFEVGEDPATSAALTVTYPGSEYPRTYQSDAPTGLWRFHAMDPGAAPSQFSVVVAVGSLAPPAAPDVTPLHAAIDWATRASAQYYSPQLRTDIDLVAAQEAVVDSLAVTYLPASPIPGVPTGFNKMTGVAYSSIIELGFVGPQLRMAVSLLQAGLAQGSRVQGNASLVAQAVAMLDAWVNATGPGFGHAVWDMQETASNAVPRSGAALGHWVDDGTAPDGEGVVYLRRVVESHRHALEAAALATEYCAGAPIPASDPITHALCDRDRASAWLEWGVSLAHALASLQASNGSFARQYALSSTPGGAPVPSQPSTTATALPLRLLVAAANATGNSSLLGAAVAAGEYAWTQFGSLDLYVGAAIDNPDVIDKESSLFAMDGYLALYEATGDPVWLTRAARASVVASSWVRVTDLPNPVDAVHSMDWFANDTSAGLALIALGHSGSDTFDSMFVWPRLALCAATGDPLHAAAARMALLNSKQPLDLSGAKGYAHPGFQSELFAFSVGWDIFSGHNDGRGVGDPHFVPWTSANAAYGVAQLCMQDPGALARLPPPCIPGVPLPPC